MFSPLETELEISTRQKAPAMTCIDVKIPGSETPAASQVAVVKNLPASARDEGSIPGSGRSPGEGHGYSLRYSCLENSMDRGAWWATVHGATESWTWLNAHTHSETAASRGEHEDTHLGILFLLPMKGHKQRSPLVPLHVDLSSPPSFVLGQIAFRLGVGGGSSPASRWVLCSHHHHLWRFSRCLAWQY